MDIAHNRWSKKVRARDKVNGDRKTEKCRES